MRRIGMAHALRLLFGALLLGLSGCDAAVARDGWGWLERQAEPGPLHPAHQDLDLACGDCHATLRGVEADACIACHALDGAVVENLEWHLRMYSGRARKPGSAA